jgi:hypothetical protein
MFSVLADGPGRYRLGDGTGVDAGWIHGKTIGFRGLRSEAEAIVAASAGWRTLQSLLRREYAAWPRQEVDWERLRFVHDGAHEWVSDGRIPLARVYRTDRGAAHARHDVAATAGSARQLAVEFVVPSWMDEEAVIPLAHALWNALAPLLGNRLPHDLITTAAPTASPEPHRRYDDVHHSRFPQSATTSHEHLAGERHDERSAFASPDRRTEARARVRAAS